MTRIWNIPIQRKLRIMVLAACGTALIVTTASLLTVQVFMFKRDFIADLTTTAEIVARSSVVALLRQDAKAGEETLGVLRAKRHITSAVILHRDGTTWASYGKPSPEEKRELTGLSRTGGEIHYSLTIFNGSERLGTLHLCADSRSPESAIFRLHGCIMALVTVVSTLAAIVVSRQVERVILRPIETLAETAREITARNDYSLRAEKLGEDELGSFTDSFNSMLDQIHSRDLALRYEIAERKRTERELNKVHLQLIETSRQAGMAEVATGVLHNVGNVLNSVNVSATLIAERLGQTRTSNLVKAATLLQSKNGSLADFLTNDDRGKVLPSYLVELGEHLDRQRCDTLEELQLLNKNIEHIKEIVSKQQSYARVSGSTEVLPPEWLVADAISLNAGSLERHHVKVVRKFQPVPPVAVDKHKVLQILINILRNATHAMDEADPVEKRLTITIARTEPHYVSIAITDMGIGIAPENLTRIFALGFTTRRRGHGFGLHSAAVAAQQLGGRLTAESDGPGRGATFTLELPISPTPSKS